MLLIKRPFIINRKNSNKNVKKIKRNNDKSQYTKGETM